MSTETYEISKILVQKAVGWICIAFLAIAGWSVVRYLDNDREWEKDQQESMKISSAAIEAGTRELLKLSNKQDVHAVTPKAHNPK